MVKTLNSWTFSVPWDSIRYIQSETKEKEFIGVICVDQPPMEKCRWRGEMSDYTTLSSENAVSSTFPLSPILVNVCIQSSNFLLSLRVSTLTLSWLFQYNFILSKVVTKRLPLTLNKLFKMHVWPCPLCYIKTSLVSCFHYYKYHNPEHAISLVQSLISTSCLKLLISLQFIIHSSIIVILTFFL